MGSYWNVSNTTFFCTYYGNIILEKNIFTCELYVMLSDNPIIVELWSAYFDPLKCDLSRSGKHLL